MIHLSSNWVEIDKELDRLEALPYSGSAPLESALSTVFLQTLGIVHVITGSLKGSGTTASDFKDDSWEGTITFGGASPGFPNDPVRYAKYEMARGGTHDFMQQAFEFGHIFPSAVRQALGGL